MSTISHTTTNDLAYRDRIKRLMLDRNISGAALAKKIGILQTTLNNQLRGVSMVSLSTIDAILRAYPTLSTDFMMRGTLPMWIDAANAGSDGDSLLRGIIRNQQREIDGLYERIQELKNTLH